MTTLSAQRNSDKGNSKKARIQEEPYHYLLIVMLEREKGVGGNLI